MSTGADDYPNFTDSQEVLLPGGQIGFAAARPASIDYAFDKDAFQLKLTAGVEYFVRVDSAPYFWPNLLQSTGVAQPRVSLFDPAVGYLTPTFEIQGTDFDVKVFRPTTSGTYFAQASSGSFSAETGRYVIYAGDVGSIPAQNIQSSNLARLASLGENLSFEFAGKIAKGRGTALLYEVEGGQRTLVTDFNFNAPSGSRITVDDRTLVLDPPANLKPGTDYVVAFREDFVRSVAGGASPAQEFTFTTATGGQPNPPGTILYSLEPWRAEFPEGQAAIFDFKAPGIAPGTEVGFVISGIQANDINLTLKPELSGLSGKVTFGPDGYELISVPLARDRISESETLTVTVQDVAGGAQVSASSKILDVEFNQISVLVDSGILDLAPTLLENLEEAITSFDGVQLGHTVAYRGIEFKLETLKGMILTVVRNGDFTPEFRQEIRDIPSLSKYADYSYQDVVALVGAAAMPAAIISVAGADGNFVG